VKKIWLRGEVIIKTAMPYLGPCGGQGTVRSPEIKEMKPRGEGKSLEARGAWTRRANPMQKEHPPTRTVSERQGDPEDEGGGQKDGVAVERKRM